MRRDWIAVACAEHVRRGVRLNIMQVCSGKAGPLRRLSGGDRVVYYSPSQARGSRDRLHSFTALGVVADDEVYQVDMGGGFRPWRRAVIYDPDAHVAPVRTLAERPGFALSGPGWGAKLRFGLLSIDPASMDAIVAAMTSPYCPMERSLFDRPSQEGLALVL